MATKLAGFRIDEVVWTAVRVRAKEAGLSAQAWMAQAVEEKLAAAGQQALAPVKAKGRAAPKVTEPEARARTVVRDTTSVPLASLSDEELRALERRLPDQRPTVTRQRPELLPVGPGPDHLGPTTPVPRAVAADPWDRTCAKPTCGHTFRAHSVRGCSGTCNCSLKHFKEPHA